MRIQIAFIFFLQFSSYSNHLYMLSPLAYGTSFVRLNLRSLARKCSPASCLLENQVVLPEYGSFFLFLPENDLSLKNSRGCSSPPPPPPRLASPRQWLSRIYCPWIVYARGYRASGSQKKMNNGRISVPYSVKDLFSTSTKTLGRPQVQPCACNEV